MNHDVLVLTSSVRTGSSTARLGAAVAGAAARHGHRPSLVHAGQLDLPLCSGAIGPVLPAVERWRRQAAAYPVHVWVAAEWHGSFPGALKNALDHLEVDQLRGKALGLVGQAGGAMPALSTISHLRTIAEHFGMWLLPTSLAVGADQIGPPLDERVAGRLDRLIGDLQRVKTAATAVDAVAVDAAGAPARAAS
ncbi:MAG TPA: NADPH-dependent FMN reductase [Acidimicrobiales bacterium]